MSYRKIEPRMWDDERFSALAPESKLVWLCILTGPHTTALPGLSVCGVASLAEAIRYRIDTVSKALTELVAAGLVRVNPTSRVILVPNAPKYNPCPNAKVLKGWLSLWKNVPDCAEKFAHIKALRASLDFSQGWSEAAWAQTFGTVSVPSRYRIETVSITTAVAATEAETVPPPSGGQGGDTSTDPKPATAEGSDVQPQEAPPVDPPKPPTKAQRRKAARAAAQASLSLEPGEGTLAWRVWAAIRGNRVLDAITTGASAFAEHVCADGAYPGVDVLAQVQRAAEHASRPENAGRYTDGRRYLSGWLRRAADDAAHRMAVAGAQSGLTGASTGTPLPSPPGTAPAPLAKPKALPPLPETEAAAMLLAKNLRPETRAIWQRIRDAEIAAKQQAAAGGAR